MPDYPIRFSIQVDEATAGKLVDVSKEQDRSVAYILRQAVSQYLDAQDKTKAPDRPSR